MLRPALDHVTHGRIEAAGRVHLDNDECRAGIGGLLYAFDDVVAGRRSDRTFNLESQGRVAGMGPGSDQQCDDRKESAYRCATCCHS